MNSQLTMWEQSQSRRLEELRSSVSDRAVLLRLLETSCLLELSRLACAQPSLDLYARLSLEALREFFPVEWCGLRIAPPGQPEINVSAGATQRPADGPDGTTALRIAVVAAGHALGEWSFAGELGGATPEFLGTLADQFSAALGGIVAAEQLRRQAGTAFAQRAAAVLADEFGPEGLQALAEALAALPGAIGAEVDLDEVSADAQPGPGGYRAGLVGAGPRSVRDVAVGAAVYGRIEVTWVDQPSSGDEAALDEVTATVAHSMASHEERRVLREQAETDPLTGLANRRRASRNLAAAFSRAERFGEPLVLLAIDLDHFKRVNDTLGHETGDDVLRVVGAVLQSTARAYDLPARMGGEEFVVVCPNTGLAGAAAVATRFLEAIPVSCASLLPAGWAQTASIGVAAYPEHSDNPAALLREADKALYAAKAAGRNRFLSAGAPAPRRGTPSRY